MPVIYAPILYTFNPRRREKSPLEIGRKLYDSYSTAKGLLSSIEYYEKEYDAREKFSDANIWEDVDKTKLAVSKSKDLLESNVHESDKMNVLNDIMDDNIDTFRVFRETLKDEFES